MTTSFAVRRVDDVVNRVPALAGMTRERIESVGTDQGIYRLTLDGRRYVMRFPDRARYIAAAAEFANQRRAAEAGVAPAPIALDPATGAIVSRWLPGAGLERLGDQRDTALAHCLARTHHRTDAFDDTIDPRRALHWNLVSPAIDDQRVAALIPLADTLLDALPASPMVNCHGDPTTGNLIGAGDSLPALRLIDWEFSHRNRATWDLAICCNDAGFDDTDASLFLARYHDAAGGCGAAPIEWRDLAIMRGIVEFASAAWLINHDAGRAPADAFERLDHARRMMQAAIDSP